MTAPEVMAHTAVLIGLDAHPVQVEVHTLSESSAMRIEGLMPSQAHEARVRVTASLEAMGVRADDYAVRVNLAPADLRKTGAGLDLAIALGVLATIGKLPPKCLEGTLLLGELSMDGALRPVRGVLPQLEAARERGVPNAVVPSCNAHEAGLVRGIDVYHAATLEEVARAMGTWCAPRPKPTKIRREPCTTFDVSSISSSAKRALESASVERCSVLLLGYPGSGKTRLARCLPDLLPPMTLDEVLQVTAIYSVAGLIDHAQGYIVDRPFRAPHYTVSAAGLLGGKTLCPGEVSLAHHGVLFLDEVTEFSHGTLDALWATLKAGRVLARGAEFPARPWLVAAAKPCPCGYQGHPSHKCRCKPAMVDRHRARLTAFTFDVVIDMAYDEAALAAERV